MRAILLVACVGCTGAAARPDGGAPEPFTYDRCDDAGRVGAFELILHDVYTSVGGRVYDGVLSTNVPEVLATVGECRLLKAPAASCPETCAPQACGVAGCEDYPSTISVGTVTVTGLEADVAMEPIAPVNAYNFAGDLPHPGFLPEADITLDAEGVALRGWGITQLEAPADDLPVEDGQPLIVTWTALSDPGPAKILVDVNLDNHGVSGSRISCEVADNGLFMVPAELVDQLLAGELSGYPTVTVTRATIDAADLAAGCVELRVMSRVVRNLVVPGLTSCSGDEDCTPPETCQNDLTCG